MKVVILAAGFGSRFGDHTLPKPLTLLENGRSILELQIERLKNKLPIHNIFVVVGFQKEKIIDHFPDLIYVYSPNFAKENTAKSLLRALNKIDDDVLWLNGDVVFHPAVLDAILTQKNTCMVVNKGQVGDEEVKYVSDEKGRILEVSKEVKNPQGEALGINFVARQDIPLLKEKLAACKANDYFEKALEMGIKEGLKVLTVPVENSLCIEIDFAEDLKKANDLLHQWNTKTL